MRERTNPGTGMWFAAWDGGIAQFTFVGEILLIAWLIGGGIRSARRPRHHEPSVPTRSADAGTRVAT